jgi:signal transduction histidine kinase
MTETMDDLQTQRLLTQCVSDEELNAQVQILAQHEYLHQVLSSIPDMVMVLNPQRQVVYANQAFLDFAGFDTLDDVIGLRIGAILGCIHAFESEAGSGATPYCRYCGVTQAFLSSQHGDHAVYEYHVNIAAEDGPPGLDLRVGSTPLTLDGQAFTLFTLTDISDEVRRRELERIFFHDLLNAAGIVRATSDLMMDVYRSETEDAASLVEQGTTMVGLIQRVANRLVREIEAQKDFTQLERNEIEIEPASLRSQALLDDLIAGFRMHEVARDRTLRLAPGSEDVRFTSDRALLSRVIENMIKNALEAVDSGETVTVGSRRAAEGVEFWVHNPTVMPERIRRQVFKRSFSTKGPGRGLGTFSMRLISERYLQGHVTFTSEPGEGTTFYAHYPLTLETERDS